MGEIIDFICGTSYVFSSLVESIAYLIPTFCRIKIPSPYCYRTYLYTLYLNRFQ
jgi:hypothetical protein